MTLPIVPNAYGFDRALAAMFCHARAGETVSIQAANAKVQGKKWGCILCKLLDILVEKGHCEQATNTSDGATTGSAALRSGALLLAVGLVLSLCSWALWALFFYLISLI